MRRLFTQTDHCLDTCQIGGYQYIVRCSSTTNMKISDTCKRLRCTTVEALLLINLITSTVASNQVWTRAELFTQTEAFLR